MPDNKLKSFKISSEQKEQEVIKFLEKEVNKGHETIRVQGMTKSAALSEKFEIKDAQDIPPWVLLGPKITSKTALADGKTKTTYASGIVEIFAPPANGQYEGTRMCKDGTQECGLFSIYTDHLVEGSRKKGDAYTFVRPKLLNAHSHLKTQFAEVEVDGQEKAHGCEANCCCV